MDNAAKPARNTYSLAPREVLMHDDERTTLRHTSRDLIDEAFVFHDYTETISIIDTIPLHANPSLPPNATFGLLVPHAYDRAHVQAVFDHIDDESFVRQATIVLFSQGKPMTLKTELVLNGDEATADALVDCDNPQFFLETPRTSTTNKNSIVPVDIEIASKLLKGIVEQASDPDEPLEENMSVAEMIHRLISYSPELSITREAKYRFTHPEQIGSVVVAIADRSYASLNEMTRPVSHAVSVASTQPLSERDSVTLHAKLSSTPKELRSVFGIDYDHEEQNDQAIEYYEELMLQEVFAFNDTDTAFPSRFGAKILEGLRLLSNTPDDYTKESLVGYSN